MDVLRQDLRHAARRLMRRPGFAAVAILTLALGIGANVAIYTVVRAVLLEPLPYAEPDRLSLVVNLRNGLLEGGWISEPEALEYREGVSSFEGVAYWTSGAANVATGAGDPERVVTARVTDGIFDVFGVPAAAGRYFGPDEWRRGGPPVVVLGHGLWQRRFAGDRAVVGSTLLVNNEAHTIVGGCPPASVCRRTTTRRVRRSCSCRNRWSATACSRSGAVTTCSGLHACGRKRPWSVRMRSSRRLRAAGCATVSWTRRRGWSPSRDH